MHIRKEILERTPCEQGRLLTEGFMLGKTVAQFNIHSQQFKASDRIIQYLSQKKINLFQSSIEQKSFIITLAMVDFI